MSFQEESNLISEQPEQFISDNEGRQYRLCVVSDDDNFFHVKLKYRDEVVGEVKCILRSPDEMQLADILVYDEVVHSPQNFFDMFLKIVFGRNKTVNYRQRGLGTTLLNFVISHAHNRGVKRVYGTVVERDITNRPSLFQWYQRHGFKVGDATCEDIPGAVARVYMDVG